MFFKIKRKPKDAKHLSKHQSSFDYIRYRLSQSRYATFQYCKLGHNVFFTGGVFGNRIYYLPEDMVKWDNQILKTYKGKLLNKKTCAWTGALMV